MKRTLLAISLLITPALSFAVAPGGPDCGWGNLVFENQRGVVPHFGAFTTNGTSGNATSGMTSGTNGCSMDGRLTYGGENILASAGFMEDISSDMARGEGESLNALAILIGVSPEDRGTFKRVTRENFAVIFPSANTSAESMLTSLGNVMKQDAILAKYAG